MSSLAAQCSASSSSLSSASSSSLSSSSSRSQQSSSSLLSSPDALLESKEGLIDLSSLHPSLTVCRTETFQIRDIIMKGWESNYADDLNDHEANLDDQVDDDQGDFCLCHINLIHTLLMKISRWFDQRKRRWQNIPGVRSTLVASEVDQGELSKQRFPPLCLAQDDLHNFGFGCGRRSNLQEICMRFSPKMKVMDGRIRKLINLFVCAKICSDEGQCLFACLWILFKTT